MHDSQLLTITYIYNDYDNKVILMASGDTLNEASEAEYLLASTNAEEVDLVEFIVNSIPLFKMAEPGSKESITHTAEDFQSLYDLPFNEIEEKVDEVVVGTSLTEVEKILSYTGPNDYIAERSNDFTQPVDYLTEDEQEETYYNPVLTESDEDDEEVLNEAGLPQPAEVMPKLLALFNKIGPVIYPQDTKDIFANNQMIIPLVSALQVLAMIVSPLVGTKYHLYVDPANVPYISSAPVSPIPSGEVPAVAAQPGSVGTLVADPVKQKQLLQQFI